MKNILEKWYAQLPFDALERIHDTSFCELNEDETEYVFSSCKREWKSMSIKDKECIFYEHYEDFSDFTTGDDFNSLFRKIKNKIEKD